MELILSIEEVKLIHDWLECQDEFDTKNIIDKYNLVIDSQETDEALQNLYEKLDKLLLLLKE